MAKGGWRGSRGGEALLLATGVGRGVGVPHLPLPQAQPLHKGFSVSGHGSGSVR